MFGKMIKTRFRRMIWPVLCALFCLVVQIPQPLLLHPGQSDQAGNPASSAAQAADPAPKLSILLLIDVSGSMNSNNKIDQAKEAAIRAVKAALKPAAGPAQPLTQPQPQTPSSVAPVIAGSGIPGIPVRIAQEFNRNLQALEALQQALGSDISTWLSQNRAGDMGEILRNCNRLMEGLSFEQQSILMKNLNPLVERMHYSIAVRVNAELKARGITQGLKYVIPGKTPAHPEFGGLFTLKPSDHDAIYFGQGADEAVNLHRELARQYGDDFLHMTESCLESSKYTIEHFEQGLRKQAFERFSGPTSNLDWMRTPSGSKWVQEYVDNAGTVVDLDALDDVAKIKPAGESGSALRSLSGYTDDELRTIGVAMDRSRLSGMGYNLGLQSDFERQLLLNRTRKGLEKGLAAASAEDTAMLMAKYGPRYEEVLKGANVSLQGTPWEGYIEKLKAAGDHAKHGNALTATQKQVIDQFDDFAGFVRRQSLNTQMGRFAEIKAKLIQAGQSGADDVVVAGLRSQMTDLIDDTQAALHNYQQLYGKNFADDLVKQISSTHDDFAKGLTRRLQNSPWVVNEAPVKEAVRTQMGLTDDAARAAAIPGKLVISDSQSLWQYARQNPGHVLAKAAQYGAYAWMSYDILSQLSEGKDYEALTSVLTYGGTEAATRLSSYMLASKFGPWAGPGVVLAAAGGFMIGNAAANWAINSRVDEMSLQMMTGYSNDGTAAFRQPDPSSSGGRDLSNGLLEYLAKARLDRTPDPNTSRPIDWIEFDNPSPAVDLTDEQIMAQFKPGTFGDTTVKVDAGGNVTITEYQGEFFVPGPMGPEMEPRYNVTHINKNQIIAHTRLQQMYQAMRGKYNADLESGNIQPGSQNVPDEFVYVDPHSNIPGSQFSIPNPGGMTMNEFTYYRKLFEGTYGRWALDKNEEFSRSSMYWGANLENASKAKWSMFRAFMEKMAEGKIKDREFRESLEKNTPEDLLALKLLAEQGIPFFLDGKKLTGDDIETLIEKKLERRREILKDMEDGVIEIKLPEDLEKILGELTAMTMGDVEIGIMPYSGGCSSTFSLFGFSHNADELEAAINSLSAGGGTPMTPALYQARHAVAVQGKGQAGTIILLCDGQNDCAENPVQAAENIRTSTYPAAPGGMAGIFREKIGKFRWIPALHAQTSPRPEFRPIDMSAAIPPERRNVPISVSTVGFQVNETQQRMLDEIAAAGGGISGSAQDIGQLAQAFTTAIQSAAQGIPAFSGGGGGGVGYAAPHPRISLPVILLIGLIGGSLLMILAILVLRYRKVPGAEVFGYLDVVYADGGKKTLPVSGGKVAIGRARDNTVVLNDENVSGHHAVLYTTDEGTYIMDSGSANGTRLNGKAVNKAWVKSGDTLTFGTTTVRLRLPDRPGISTGRNP